MEIYPRSLKFRVNYALYLMYAGAFAEAASEAQRVVTDDPSLGLSYLPLAVNALDERKLDQAAGIYERAAATGSVGASLAAIGLADLAMSVGKLRRCGRSAGGRHRRRSEGREQHR